MIELTVLNYLKSALNVPVYMEKPTGTIEEYVVIEKTSSSRENYINTAMFAIQSYSDTMYNAALLNEEVKNAMIGDGVDELGITAATNISKCSLNSDYNFTDQQTKSYRYQAVFDLVF